VSVVVGGGCARGGVPLGAVPALSWYGEVSLGGNISSASTLLVPCAPKKIEAAVS